MIKTAAAVAALVFASPVLAAQQSAPDNEIIDIASDYCEILQAERKSICTGNVRVVRGDAVLSAPKMTVFQGEGESGVDRIIAEGGVRYARPGEAISGDMAVYDDAEGTIVVTGDVLITQGRQVARGAKLIYDIDTQRTQLFGEPGGRVRGLFFTSGDEADT